MEEQELKLIFIPGPGVGHIISAVEVGKLILSRDNSLSITFLLINDKPVREYVNSIKFESHQRLEFINLPELESSAFKTKSELRPVKAVEHVDRHKPLVREAVVMMMEMKVRVVGFVVDMFCPSFIDVADEFLIPSYVFYTSGAGFLSLMLSMQRLADENGVELAELKGSDREFAVDGFLNPVPAKVLPSPMIDRNGGAEVVVAGARGMRKARGIFINTFEELEPTVIHSLSNSNRDENYKVPQIYPIGPLINLKTESESKSSDIMSWLDRQPNRSVLFLCFGSLGSFNEAQIQHLAAALESSGRRFLWSMRMPKERETSTIDEILPEGFLQRTEGIGKVITGWAPQTAVLSHAAVGGFVSHCGWNSVLESLWFGVPMAAWPMYAEQQINAFQLVVEIGVAVEIKMDYRDNEEIIVSKEEIAAAIEKLMEGGNGVRERAEEMRGKSLRAVENGGSSYKRLTSLVNDFRSNSLLPTKAV